MTDFETIDILELIPQRPPFVMIDRLEHFDEVFTRTGFTISSDNIFVEEGVLTQAGITENIAQTCAVRMGYINKYVLLQSVKIGFIGSIKNLVFERLPKVGERLTTTVEVQSEVFAITLVNAKTEVDGQTVASCEMKISITDME